MRTVQHLCHELKEKTFVSKSRIRVLWNFDVWKEKPTHIHSSFLEWHLWHWNLFAEIHSLHRRWFQLQDLVWGTFLSIQWNIVLSIPPWASHVGTLGSVCEPPRGAGPNSFLWADTFSLVPQRLLPLSFLVELLRFKRLVSQRKCPASSLHLFRLEIHPQQTAELKATLGIFNACFLRGLGRPLWISPGAFFAPLWILESQACFFSLGAQVWSAAWF